MSTLNDAIAAAQAQAAQAAQAQPAPAPAGVPATVTATGAAPAPAMMPAGQKMSLEDFSTGALNVDDFLKVKEHGLTVGKHSDKLVAEAIVDIDLSEVQVCEAIKFGQNPPTYFKTYDGVTCVQGGTWQQAVMKAQQVDPNARPYKSADIPMTVVEDIVAIDKTVVAEKGTTLGHSLSTTNRGEFQDLLSQVGKAGISMHDTVRVKLKAKPRTNAKGHRWGIITFELLGVGGDETEAEAA